MISVQTHPKGYKTLANILNDYDVAQFKIYFELLQKYNFFKKENTFVQNSLRQYGDIVGESLLLDLQPYFEEATQKKLIPSYSYFRIYHNGSDLKRHRDRPACEVSSTMTIDYKDGEGLWPIFIELNDQKIPISLDKGEALIYYGHDTKHWRETFKGTFSSHVFLHYIDANGPFLAHQFDKRNKIFGKPNFRKVLEKRIFSLTNLPAIHSQSTLQVTIPIDYQIEKDKFSSIILFNRRKEANLQVPTIYLPFVEKVLEQSNAFKLDEVRDDLNEKIAITLLKKLIILGYIELITVD